jgi:uncharacterized repeat protein (TIGR03837 family)
LAQEWGFKVTLRIDRPEVLQRLHADAQPGRCCLGVQIDSWEESTSPRPEQVADVVIAAFGCDLPPAYRAALRSTSAVWINLEYFSAEPWTEGTHGLASPKPQGGVEHFFFPGLGARTGGMLREQSLIARRNAYWQDPLAQAAFLTRLGVFRPEPVRRVSVFCYPMAHWPALLDALHAVPAPAQVDSDALPRWQVLVPDGVLDDALPPGKALQMPKSVGSDDAVHSGHAAPRASVEVCRIPFLSQDDYDHLLWTCDLNLVRGEDSLVRALWAGKPMLWQAYPQHDQVHLPKVQAWLDHLCEGRGPVADAWLAWNDDRPSEQVGQALAMGLQAWPDWVRHSTSLSAHELALPDLAQRLVDFARHARD